jgi:hypothetical protein
MAKKFYRTVMQVEILSEDEPYGEGVSLEEINYAITEGHCSGVIKCESSLEVTPKQMASLLIAQGSDPEFMQLDKNGNIIKDE